MYDICNAWLEGSGRGPGEWAVLAVFEGCPEPQVLAVDLRLQLTGFGPTGVVVSRDVVTLELRRRGECPGAVALEAMFEVADLGVCPDTVLVGEPKGLEPEFTLESSPFVPPA